MIGERTAAERTSPISARLIIVGVLALLSVGGSAYLLRSRADQVTAPTYVTAPVTRGDVAITVSATGPITAGVSSPLTFKNAGRIAQIPVQAGVGAEPVDQRIRHEIARSGRLLTDFDEATQARTAVIGQTVAGQLFAGRDPIGATIQIRGGAFEVVGVLVPKGHSASADLDDLALVPFSTAEQRLDGYAGLSQIVVQVASTTDVPATMGALTTTLRAEHRLRPGEPSDFQVTNQQALIDLGQEQTAFFARVLTVGALIALALGGVGVTNLMLMAVAERRPEIGLRLAVGAQPRDVQVQFLIEALAVTALGGAIGTLAGVLASAAIPRVVPALASYRALPSLSAGGVALLVSLLIGVAGGFYPARKASLLQPIAALRDDQ